MSAIPHNERLYSTSFRLAISWIKTACEAGDRKFDTLTGDAADEHLTFMGNLVSNMNSRILVSNSMPDWLGAELDAFSNDRWHGDLLPACLIPIVIVAYGVFHALAWHKHFPTPGEALLWRIRA